MTFYFFSVFLDVSAWKNLNSPWTFDCSSSSLVSFSNEMVTGESPCKAAFTKLINPIDFEGGTLNLSSMGFPCFGLFVDRTSRILMNYTSSRIFINYTTARFKSRRRFIKTSAIARGKLGYGQIELASPRKLPEFYHVVFPGYKNTIFSSANRT